MKSETKTQATPRLQAAQRHAIIVKALSETGFVTVPEMARACHVSEMTMRRDLDHLAGLNQIERTHGGAVSLDRFGSTHVDLVEPNISARSTVNASGKSAIARCAATLVDAEQTIALDIGTTALSLAELLCDHSLNIYTSSLKIADVLSGHRPSVFVPGGRVFGSEPSVVGPQAVKGFSELCFDIAFVGVSGVSTAGFYDYSLEDTYVKRALIEGSQKVVVLLDSTKFDRMSVARVCTFNEVDLMITDAAPPKDLMDRLEASGVAIQIAE